MNAELNRVVFVDELDRPGLIATYHSGGCLEIRRDASPQDVAGVLGDVARLLRGERSRAGRVRRNLQLVVGGAR